MRNILVFLFIILFALLVAKNGKNTIPALRNEVKSQMWYKNQAQLWYDYLIENKSDDNAYLQLFNSMAYIIDNNFVLEQDHKSKIESQKFVLTMIKNNLPKSFVDYYLDYRYFNSNKKYESLLKASEIQPDNINLIYDMIVLGERTNDSKLRKNWNQKLDNLKGMDENLYNFATNILSSLTEKSVLIVHGDNDTFPIWLLQDVYNFRKDVIVISYGLAHDNSYFKKFLKKNNLEFSDDIYEKKQLNIKKLISHIAKSGRDIYIANTCSDTILNKLEKNIFNTGLVYKYSSKRVNNIALLKRNFEFNYRLDYLFAPWHKNVPPQIKIMNKNYLNGMIKLMEHYEITEEVGRKNYWLMKIIRLCDDFKMNDLKQHFESRL